MDATQTGMRDLRLPSQEHDHHLVADRGGPVRWLLMAVNAVGVAIVMLVYLIAAPFVALGTGAVRIATEIRDTAVRPRPFVGSRHGLPFLDPPPPPPGEPGET